MGRGFGLAPLLMVTRIQAPAPPAESETPTWAIPSYPKKHAGCVLILGFADGLEDDMARAHALRPHADVIAVNAAATAHRADHVYSWHWNDASKLPWWAAQQHERFNQRALVHSTPGRDRKTGILNPVPQGPEVAFVDHWWPGATANGSSGWMAVRLACFLGYEERILCGIPIGRAAYADLSMAKDWQRDAHVERYRRGIEEQTGYHAGTYSMSGWTRDLLGEPPR